MQKQQPLIHFYYEDFISYIKTQKSIPGIQNNSKKYTTKYSKLNMKNRTIHLESIF